METIEKIQKELKKNLSEKRYLHSIGVMNMAKELAKNYQVNEQKVALVGLTHDIAKELSIKEALDYVKKNKLILDQIEKYSPALLHAKIGADMVRKKYHFNMQMQNAIKYHTTGNPNMDKLAKIIYIADKTEENRKFEGVEKLRELAFKNLDEAMVAILNFDIKKNINKGVLIHPNSVFTRNKLIRKSTKNNAEVNVQP